MVFKRQIIEARLLAGMALAVAVPFAETMAPARVAAGQINPGYFTNFDEKQAVVGDASQPSINPYQPSSYAYYFDTITDGTVINGLGLAIFSDWNTRPNKAPYDVYLWSYDGILNPTAHYNVLAKVTFDPALASTYAQKNGYYWLPLTTDIDLGKETASSAARGFAVGAVGDFTWISSSDLQARNLPYLYDGTGTFATTVINYDGNGFNNPYSTYYADMNDPLDYYSVPASANDPLSFKGFFNANISYFDVPAPAPLLATAAAFRWSRRLRRRQKGKH